MTFTIEINTWLVETTRFVTPLPTFFPSDWPWLRYGVCVYHAYSFTLFHPYISHQRRRNSLGRSRCVLPVPMIDQNFTWLESWCAQLLRPFIVFMGYQGYELEHFLAYRLRMGFWEYRWRWCKKKLHILFDRVHSFPPLLLGGENWVADEFDRYSSFSTDKLKLHEHSTASGSSGEV